MRHDLPHLVLAAAVLTAIAWLPGTALSRLLAPRLPRLAVLAAAPAVSAGVLYALGELATRLGAPVDGRLAAGTVVLALCFLVVTERQDWRTWSPARLPRSVLGAWAVGLVTWTVGIGRLLAVPPHNDGYNHGYSVALIARRSTLDPAQVIPHDVVSGGLGAAFYPLALHQQAAVLVRATHLDVGLAWTLTSLSLVVIALPLGMFVLGRTLFPQNTRGVQACAWIAALTPGISYSTSWWGGFPLAAGMSLVPGTLVCLLHGRESRNRGRTALLGGTALAGIAGVHTSEYTFLAVVASVILVGPALTARAPLQALRGAVHVALPYCISLALLLPVLAQLHRGVGERTFAPEAVGLPFSRAVLEVLVQYSFVPPATPPALVVASWVGIVVVLRRRTALAWLSTWVLFGVVYVWLASFPSGLINALTASWYSDRFRLGMMLSFLSIPLVALAVAGPLQGATRNARLLRTASLLLAGVLGITSTVASVRAIRHNYRDYSLVGPDQRAAFSFLAAHARPGERVLNQHQDGSPWMYSLFGVAPVFAVKTNNYESSDWNDALYLSRHVAEAGRDARTDALLAKFDVRYVYVGDKVFPTEKPDIRASELAASPSFREVFSRGTAHVFERRAGRLPARMAP